MEALRERFGKYHVIGKIAQGGMAEVYKVKTVGIAGFEKIQALKRILPNQAREARFIRSFVDEARIAVELTHRNIVQVFDFGKADGELFLAMELIEGKDLRTAMSEAAVRQVMPAPEVAAYIVSEVAAGLDYAHRKTDGYGGSLAIVHCDVSPSNVMISVDGYVKILDFGIARASFASALERRRLRGKPRYMSPEQTLGETPTIASDVFALGIIAWEMFTGLPLFRGTDLKSTLEAVRRTVPPRVDKLSPHVPAAIADAIAVALTRDPNGRGTAADLGAACARLSLGGAAKLAEWIAEIAPRAQTVGSSPTIVWHPAAPPAVSAAVDPALDMSLPPSARAATRPITPRHTTRAPTTNERAPVTRPSTTQMDLQPMGERPSTTEITDTAPPFGGAAVGGQAPDVEMPAFDEPPTAESLPFPDEPTQFGSDGGGLPLDGSGAEWRRGVVDSPGSSLAELALDDALSNPLLTVRVPPSRLTPVPVTMRDDAEAIDDDIAAPQPAAAAIERRRAVIVAAVLAGAPPAALRPIAKSLGELAYQRGGVVAGSDDDGVVVAFGLEVAGEDDVAIAMGWALDASALAQDSGAGVALRVGARTGVATTGGMVPADAADEARALARDAAPDRPRFVGASGRITSGLFTLREVPSARRSARFAAGSAPPRSQIMEVVAPRTFDERDQARRARRGKLFGRTAQLAQLDGWLGRAIEADRRLAVLVTGAAGSGKSRLVAELLARHGEARAVIVAATPASRFAPFSAVIDVYQAALGMAPSRGRDSRAEVVERLLHLTTKAGLRPERAQAIAADLGRAMELRDGAAVGAPEVADLRPRVSAGLAAFRAVVSDRARPTITVIEDVHHADNPSLEVLRHILGVPAAMPELLVLTARPGSAMAPAVDSIIELGDLVGSDLRAMIADRLGDAATPGNIAAVIGRGGGNPLFVEELAAAVRDAGADSHAVPASARDVMAARVDRLSPSAKLTLRYAVVLGGDVRVRLLEELVAAENVQELIDELVAAELVEAHGEEHGDATEGTIALAYGLVGEVVYDALPPRAQQEAHARVGRLLASRFFAGRDEPPAVIADHLERAGEAGGAAAFWLRAGRLALVASDTDAAVACFTRSLANNADAEPTRAARTRRREALLGREEAHRLQGDLAADPTDLDELDKVCAGDPARLGEVALRRAQRLLRQGDHAGAMAATDVTESRAVAVGDDRLRGEALRVRGEVLERLGRFDDALAQIDAACELFASVGAASEEMAAMVGRGRIHLVRAHYEAAQAAYAPVLERIGAAADAWLERVARIQVAITEVCLGNFEAAMVSAQRALELCRRAGARAREGDALRVVGTILVEVGLDDAAAEQFADGLDILARTSSRWSRADCLIQAGACDARRGLASGAAMLDEALGEARRLDARYLEASARIARATVRVASGELVAAIDDATQGVAAARAAGLVGYEIQGLAMHALALARGGFQLGDAAALASRAMALLAVQKHLEGSEEDVYTACAEALHAAGQHERGRFALQAARTGRDRKLAGIRDADWRVAFVGRTG